MRAEQLAADLADVAERLALGEVGAPPRIRADYPRKGDTNLSAPARARLRAALADEYALLDEIEAAALNGRRRRGAPPPPPPPVARAAVGGSLQVSSLR